MIVGQKKKKIFIGMVGLPARGKNLSRYINWIGFHCKVFNIGNYRREIAGSDVSPSFFDPDNKNGSELREKIAHRALEELITFLQKGGDVAAIFDGTNTTKERRKSVFDKLNEEFESIDILWIESICDIEDIIETNISKNKIITPDFKGKSIETSIIEFRKRIDNYRKVYETLSHNEYEKISFMKVINLGEKIILTNVSGYYQSKITSYMFNTHIQPRPIYLVLSGDSVNVKEGKCGGDPELSENGIIYSNYLKDFFAKEKLEEPQYFKKGLKMLTSTLKRATQTADCLDFEGERLSLKVLDDIDYGSFEEKTPNYVETHFPLEYKQKMKDPFHYRFPRGESYQDLVHRIESAIFEIERSRMAVIVISHLATMKCLYAYFSKKEISGIPFIEIRPNNIIKMIPESYSYSETRFEIDISKDGEVSKIETSRSDYSPFY